MSWDSSIWTKNLAGPSQFQLSNVDLRNVQTSKNFYEFIWAKLTTFASKQNINVLRKMLRPENGGFARVYLKSIADRFREVGESKERKSLGLDKKKNK